MATAINSGNAARGADESYFFRMACAMAAVMVAGFSLQLAMGRSSFGAPFRVHAHAVIFFGWIVLFLTQARLASRGNFALHRRLGQLAALWMAAMVAAGLIVTVALVQEGRAPFFFYPQQFLIADPVNLLAFVGLTLIAVQHRQQPDWHMRLQICAFASIMGPGIGRLLPMPLLAPYAFEAAALVPLVFPLIGMARDSKQLGRVHPAWLRGSAAIVAMVLVFDLLTYSPFGNWLYAAVTAGTPAAAVPGLALPPPPPM